MRSKAKRMRPVAGGAKGKAGAKRTTRRRARHGFTFRHPDGELDYRVTDNVGAARSNAAFACDRPHSHIVIPLDWDRAQAQGFQIVRATILVRGAALEEE